MLNANTIVRLCCASAGLGCAPAAWAQALFTPLGDLPGGADRSVVGGLSADGRVVCGSSGSAASGDARSEAFVWTADGGMQGLGDLVGGLFDSHGDAISDDGRIVVGDSASWRTQPPNREGFFWNASDGMSGIGLLNGASPVLGVSGDGRTLVGFSVVAGVTQGFKWTASDGFTALGLLTRDSMGFAHDANADGSLVVGFATTVNGQRPRVWTAGGGLEPLFDAPGAALAVSADGRFVTGRYGMNAEQEPLRWTAASHGGVGNAPGTDAGTGWDVNADGRVIVGAAQLVGASDNVAIVWIEGQGTHQLQQWLIERFGLHLDGWTLARAVGVSDDGLVIAGHGQNPAGAVEAWRLELPWLHCPADWDRNGLLGPGDLAAFGADWSAGAADFDGDGRVDTRDYLAFLNALAAGC